MKAPTILFYLWFPLPFYLFLCFVATVICRVVFCPTEKQPYVTLNALETNGSAEATIGWESTSASICTIFYRATTEEIVHSRLDLERRTMHWFQLRGLQADTEYKYAISCQPGSDPVLTYNFRTFTRGRTKRFVLIGDTQINPTGISHMPMVMAAVERYVPEYTPMIIVGDLVHKWGSQALWNLFFTNSDRVLRTKSLFTIPGNHDCKNTSMSECLYRTYFLPETFQGKSQFAGFGHALVADDVLIVGMTDYEELDHQYWEGQTRWLRSTFEKFKSKRIKIFLGHRPFFYPEYMEDREGPMEELLGLMEKYNVSLFLNGHQHAYRRFSLVSSRTNHNIVNVCVGGGGGTLESLLYWKDVGGWGFKAILQAQNLAPSFATLDIGTDSVITIKAFTVYGALIDEVSFFVAPDGKVEYRSGLYPPKGSDLVAVAPQALVSIMAYLAVVAILIYVIASFVVGGDRREVLYRIRTAIHRKASSAFVCGWASASFDDTAKHSLDLDLRVDAMQQKLQAGGVELRENSRKDVCCFLACRLVLGFMSYFYTMIFAFSAYSFYAIFFREIYTGNNSSHFVSQITISILYSVYMWKAINFLECSRMRIIVTLALISTFIVSQSAFASTFQIFDCDVMFYLSYVVHFVLALFFEFLLPLGLLEIARGFPGGVARTLTGPWQKLFLPLSLACTRHREDQVAMLSPREISTEIKRQSTCLKTRKLLLSGVPFCVFSMILVGEHLLGWCGLSISEVVAKLYYYCELLFAGQ